MSKPKPPPAPNPEPHTVPAGVMDALLGLRGPNGELMHQGRPALVRDLPDDPEDDED